MSGKNVTVADFMANLAKEREIEEKKLSDKIKRKWRRKDHSKGWRRHVRHLKAAKRRGERPTPNGWVCTHKVQKGEAYSLHTRRYEPIFKNCEFYNPHDAKICGRCHHPHYIR